MMELKDVFGLLLALKTCTAAMHTLTSEKLNMFWERSPEDKCQRRWFPYQAEKYYGFDTASTNPSSVPCSLITEKWELPDNINVVYGIVQGTMTNCSYYLNRKCSNTFNLKVNAGRGKKNNSFKLIAMLPNKTSEITGRTFRNYKDTITIPVKNSNYLRLNFESVYWNGVLNGLTIYYYKCPTRTSELVHFTARPAPIDGNIITVTGQCADNAVSDNAVSPYMKCYMNGTARVYGRCICKKGFQPDNFVCKACSRQEYKPLAGNHDCRRCGANSVSKKSHGVECMCKQHYFRTRGLETNSSEECLRPPDAPYNITSSNISHNMAVVSWKAPSPGSQPLGVYRIKCVNCPDLLEFSSNATVLVMIGLKSLAVYTMKIYNYNSVTRMIDENNWQVAEFTFNTTVGGRPGVVRDLGVLHNNDGSVTLHWVEPFSRGGHKLKYVLKYGDVTKLLDDTQFTIKMGTEDKEYEIQIYAQTYIRGHVVEGALFMYDQVVRVKGGIPLSLTVAVGAGVVLMVTVFLIAVFCVWRKRHPAHLQVVRMENGAVEFRHKLFSTGKVYVDPTTYNAVDDAVQDFAIEITRKDLVCGPLLGGGEFAEVFKGTLYRNGLYKDVAIKTLKSGANKRDRDDFFSEAAILGQFSDCANVVKLEGVILKERPNLIILEYMSNGALDSYLQNNDNKFDVTQLLGMGRDVAKGMTYLSQFGFIHRDLAARNILVDEFNVCKVSDFGMSRAINLDDSDTYDTQGGKIPVRWTAPEAIQFKKFTTASDIWSYGILLWEVMSFGERPYWDWGNYQVMERLNTGYRLPPPMNCPKVIHDLMLKCWHKDRTKRPKFKEIVDQIEQWISTPTLLREVASVVRKRDENLDYTVLETINKWLEAIGMQRYTETFLHNGYSTPRQILSLNLEDLEKLPIGPIGHKMKIFKAIQNTKLQVEARHNNIKKNGKKK